MKWNFWLFLSLFLFAFIACEEDDNNVPRTGDQRDELRSTLIDGNAWRISTFIEDGDDDTDDFINFTFRFDSNGNVVATNSNSGNRVEGRFRVFVDDGKTEMEMNWPDRPAFDELDDDWYLISLTNNVIRLEDPSDDDQEVLVFTRVD